MSIHTSKGQMEILGVAIIVLLLSLGVLFYVKFSVLAPEENPRSEFENTQLASNMLNTLLRTSTGDNCKDNTITQLLQDCAKKPSRRLIQCTVGDPTYNSCDVVWGEIDKILDKTLGKWFKTYELYIWGSGTSTNFDTVFSQATPIKNRDASFMCSPIMDRESKLYPIPADGGATIFLKLDLCFG